MTRSYLGMGANIGDPARQMARALAALKTTPGIMVSAVSSLYLSPPEGSAAQPDYWNAVAAIETSLAPQALLAVALHLETQAGRERSTRGAPRPLDIDLLLMGDWVVAEPHLRLPHPRMLERAFVMLPLAEIAPAVLHPVAGRTAMEIAGRLSGAPIKIVAGKGWAERL